MGKIGVLIPRSIMEKIEAGKELTKEDLNSVTFTGGLCCVCDKEVETGRAISDREITSEEVALQAEVIVHVTDKGEWGCDNRYYHADCFWREQEQIHRKTDESEREQTQNQEPQLRLFRS